MYFSSIQYDCYLLTLCTLAIVDKHMHASIIVTLSPPKRIWPARLASIVVPQNSSCHFENQV